MKKILYSICFLSYTLGYSQLVGINTYSPMATLHITDFDAVDGVIESPRKEAGLKIPTHSELPTIPFDTPAEKVLSEEKNGMLVHLYSPETSTQEESQGFYYWDNNAYSWQNIIDSKNLNLDTSKTIAISEQLDQNIVGASSSKVIFNQIKTWDDDFYISNNGEIVIGKPANYYLLLTGAILKEGRESNITLSILQNDNPIISTATALPNDTNGENRVANFFVSKILTLDKNDKISVSATGHSNITRAYTYTPFSITLIKLD